MLSQGSRLPFLFLLGSVIPTLVSGPAASPLDERYLTCKGMCGLTRRNPCSCHSGCLVLNNCCEDFAESCSRQYESDLEKFAHMADANVVCTEMNYLIISSCLANKTDAQVKPSGTAVSPNGLAIRPRGRKKRFSRNVQADGDSKSLREETKNSRDGDLGNKINRHRLSNDSMTRHGCGVPPEDASMKKRDFVAGHGKKMCTFLSEQNKRYVKRMKLQTRKKTITENLPKPRRARDTTLNSNPKQSFLEIINSSPVIDKSTGFIYANLEAYECYAMAESSILRWDTTFELNVQDNPTSTNDLYNNLGAVRYFPPFSLPSNVTLPRCIFDAIQTCPDGKQDVSLETKEKCENGSLAYVRDEPKTGYYKNPYCFECHFGPFKPYTPIKAGTDIHTTPFSVIASFSDDTGSVKLIVEDESGRLTWKTATCDLSEASQASVEDSPCTLDKCKAAFTYRNGKCQQRKTLNIAVADDAYPLREFQVRSLPQFMTCFLERHLHLEITDHKEDAVTRYNETLGQNLYITEHDFYFTNKSFEQTIGVKSRMIISAMAKAFRLFRSEVAGEHALVEINEDVVQEDNTIRVSDQPLDLNADRGNMVDNSTTAVCLSVDDTMLEELSCFQEPVYENDQEIIAELKNSTCFTIFPEDVAFSGANICEVSFLGDVCVLLILLAITMY